MYRMWLSTQREGPRFGSSFGGELVAEGLSGFEFALDLLYQAARIDCSNYCAFRLETMSWE